MKERGKEREKEKKYQLANGRRSIRTFIRFLPRSILLPALQPLASFCSPVEISSLGRSVNGRQRGDLSRATNMASKSAEYVFSCDKCPRSFKLKEFYEKHKKVHELKKQHACDVCGYVYGAAKGLEGHLKTHSAEELAAVALKQMMMSAARPVIAPPVAAVVQHPAAQLQPHIVAAPPAAMAPSMAHLLHAPHINFHFLNPQGVLAAAAAQQHPLIPAPAVLPASVSPPAAPEIAPTGTGNYKIYGEFFPLMMMKYASFPHEKSSFFPL